MVHLNYVDYIWLIVFASCSTGNAFVNANLANCVFFIVIHSQNCMALCLQLISIVVKRLHKVGIYEGRYQVPVNKMLWQKRFSFYIRLGYHEIHFLSFWLVFSVTLFITHATLVLFLTVNVDPIIDNTFEQVFFVFFLWLFPFISSSK